MSEENERLVHHQIETELAGKQISFGTMAYNEGQDTGGNGEIPVNSIVHDASLNTLDAADNGELIESPEETSILAQFHEEAIRQAGCGYSQVQVLLATILALSGATIEYAVIPFIVTSAAIEFCIEDHKKNWLAMITILGLALGAIFWGCLAGYVGKKRTLTSCLAVNAVFAVIAAVMPTYGIFMMARLCSSIGAGGILPASLGLVRELSPPSWRSRVTALLLLGIGLGQLYATGLASVLVPTTGLQAFIENKAHLSAWHRYLLICTLPTLASLVSLIWTHESPKYLLENGREVDALVVYQEIHTSNGRWRCAGDFSSEQLDLPPTKHPQHNPQPLYALFRPLCAMWRPPLGARTARLGLVLALTIFTQILVSYHAPTLRHAIIRDKYSLVDSDIVSSRDTFSCQWSGVNVVAGVAPACARRLDLWSRTSPYHKGAVAYASGAVAAAFVALIGPATSKRHSLLAILLICLACTPALYFSESEMAIFSTEAVFIFLLLLVHYLVVLIVYENYQTNVSCATHGLMLGAGLTAALCGAGQSDSAVLAGAALALAAAASVGI